MTSAGESNGRGQLISMTEWRVPDGSAADERPARRARVTARRRAAREERQIARAARQLAGAIRSGDSDSIDWWQDALADLDCA
jgi:hypothetical protein